MRKHTVSLFLLILFGAVYAAASPWPKQGAPAPTVSAPLSLEEEQAAARQEGLPLTPQELQAPLPPPEQNAAPVYQQLTQLLKAHPISPDDVLALEKVNSYTPLAAADIARAREIIAQRSDVFDLIHRAAQRPQNVVVRDWAADTAGMGLTLFPELARTRSYARWIQAESMVVLYDGKPVDAVRTQALGFMLARHVGSEPQLSSHLTAGAIEAITLSGLKRILQVAGDQAAVSAAAADSMRHRPAPFPLRYYLGSELVGGLTILGEVNAKNVPSRDIRKSPEYREIRKKYGRSADAGVMLQRWKEASAASLIHQYRREINVIGLPFREANAQLAALSAEFDAHRDPNSFLVLMSDGAMDPLPTVTARSDTQNGVVIAAAEILEFKAAHGTFPDRLEDAMPTVPTDLFNTMPLRYRREPGGFVVYSVGPTGKFDGGKPGMKHAGREIYFRYPL